MSAVFLCRNSIKRVLTFSLLILTRTIMAEAGALSKKDSISQITKNSESEKAIRHEPPTRISLLGGYQTTLGNLKDILPNGIEARLALDLPLGRGAWPALRLELGYAGFGSLPGNGTHSVTGMAWGTGPVWFLRPSRHHTGQIIGGFLAGSILARVQGPTVETQTNLFAAIVLLGYEYPLGPVLLFVQARSGYVADQNNPLMSAGGVMGVARPLFDN